MAKSRTQEVYDGSNGAATRWFCKQLEDHGHIGRIAAALFHIQKTSSRAKTYRGGVEYGDGKTFPYKDIAYRRKGEFLERLVALLAKHSFGMRWGWGHDDSQPKAQHVLYVALPQGQVSLHSLERYAGPDYPDAWDGMNANAERVIAFCDWVWSGNWLGRMDIDMDAFVAELKEALDGVQKDE